MTVCFVHAPLDNGWNGEILLVLNKREGHFRLKDVERMVSKIYTEHDKDSFHYDNNVALDRVKDWNERKERAMMQRRSAYGTYEDLYFDEWIKGISRHYYHLAKFAKFILPIILHDKSL